LRPSATPQTAPAAAVGSGGAGTKERLLRAAERLFAERGFEGTSVRAVTQAAGASVSAANYHFGSKLELLGATLRRQVEPINRRRLERLSELEAQPVPPDVEAIVEAYIGPAFERAAEVSDQDRALLRHVAVRLWTDPPEIVAALRSELFGVVNERFSAALAGTLPGVPADRARILLQLSVGLLVHTLNGQVEPRSESDADTLRATVVRFATAGVIAAAREGE
jgi:AcrR family transcriptional regulator